MNILGSVHLVLFKIKKSCRGAQCAPARFPRAVYMNEWENIAGEHCSPLRTPKKLKTHVGVWVL
jgi:hypothetical protein